MLRHILFDVEFFATEAERENSQKRVLWLLQALTNINRLYLQQHPETPLIYKSGIKYKVPEQFERADVPELGVLERFVHERGAPDEVKGALKSIAGQVGGGEHFRDIPRIIENGGGDCLPVDTFVALRDHVPKRIGDVQVGDELLDLSGTCHVEKVWPRSVKPTVTLFLDNGSKLVSSLDHRHMVAMSNGAHAVRAEQILVGNTLRSSTDKNDVKVRGIERSAERECVDITTSTGTFWLPESDVLTHNCDNVAAWRAAELCEMGIPARPYITWRQRADGGTTYHVIVMLNDGTSEDPSLLLGMGGASRAADRKEEERKMGERLGDFIAGYSRGKRSAAPDTIFGGIITPQNFNQLQYTIPFQNDDAYEDWSPTRPQGFYNNPYYPNLPSTPGGVPIFNTRIRDVDDLPDFDDRMDRFDGEMSTSRANMLARKIMRGSF